jgi:hypothetical protein
VIFDNRPFDVVSVELLYRKSEKRIKKYLINDLTSVILGIDTFIGGTRIKSLFPRNKRKQVKNLENRKKLFM